MPRTRVLRDLVRALRLAQFCEARRLPTAEAIPRLAGARTHPPAGASRRTFLARAGALALAGAAPGHRSAATRKPRRVRRRSTSPSSGPAWRDHVAFDASVGLTPDKRYAIDHVVYGANAKLHVAMRGRFWGAHGSNGEAWTDLPNAQLVWEPNPANATPLNAVLLDYSGGDRAASLHPRRVQIEAARFVADLDRVLPGALAHAATGAAGRFVAHLEHWPSDPWTQGAYTCNQPGYFTRILGKEAPPVGNLFFAAETTDPFYPWQGFMEGAANSGIRAANEVLAFVG